MNMCSDTDKETSSVYNIKRKENTSSTSENKEKPRDGYVFMYKFGKHLCHSTYEPTFTGTVIYTNKK